MAIRLFENDRGFSPSRVGRVGRKSFSNLPHPLHPPFPYKVGMRFTFQERSALSQFLGQAYNHFPILVEVSNYVSHLARRPSREKLLTPVVTAGGNILDFPCLGPSLSGTG